MKMEELLSAAADEMEGKHTQRSQQHRGRGEKDREREKEKNNKDKDDYDSSDPDYEPTSSSSSSRSSDTVHNASNTSDHPHLSSKGKAHTSPNTPLVSPRNSIRTRSKREPTPIADDEENGSSSANDDSQPSPTPPPPPQRGGRGEPVLQCKTPGCVVCLKGPPSSFSKGTPIWAQILHLVLYALTESAKVSVVGSPKMKVKRYFHLRDDIYEYISIHWDVICRRERIKNWRHTIGMTLSHYQNLFQNGYHIYQNTGYWSMKDNVPSPYAIDPLIGEGSSPGKKRKYSHPKPNAQEKEKDSPFINEFPATLPDRAPSRTTTTTTTTTTTQNTNDNDLNDDKREDGKDNNNNIPVTVAKGTTLPSLATATYPFSQAIMQVSGAASPVVRFDEMKNEIDRFKKEMGALQSEIDALHEQLQLKKAEEHLLKFLQEGISSFRDKIKQRIDLLRAEMVNNHSEHQQQIHTMASELTQLREIGADLRNAFQYQFARLAHLNTPHS